MARVDIVMPLYNKAHCVGRALRSIQCQTVTDWHLIVVDDGSTDDGAEVVKKIHDDRIELIHQENAGPGAARNAGISRATAGYLAFLDADDEWYPWYLENALRAIEENDVALVCTHYYEWPKKIDMTRYWARRGVHAGRYDLQGEENPAWVESLLLFPHVGNSLLRTEIARQFGGFYDRDRCAEGEDTIFFMRVAINVPMLVISPPAVIHHREQSQLSSRKSRPLSPLLTDPEVVLDYCPDHKQVLLRRTIARFALRVARNRARWGQKDLALELLRLFPQAKSFRTQYLRCRYEITLSRFFPYWTAFKCAIGPPVRIFLKSWAWKLRLTPKIPDLPGLNEDNKKN